MKKTRLGNINRIRQGLNLYNKNLSNYVDSTGNDYLYERQQKEALRYPEEETSLWEDVLNTGATIGANVLKTTRVDLPNSLRMLADRWVSGKISEANTRKYFLQEENEDLLKIEDYYNLLDQYKNSLSPEEKSQLKQRIEEYDNFFLGDGKSHVAIALLMFDKSLIPTGKSVQYSNAELAQFATRANQHDSGVLRKENGLLGNLKEIGGYLVDTATNALSTGINSAIAFLGQRGVTGNSLYITNEAIMSSDKAKDNYLKEYIPYMYVGGIHKSVDGVEYTNVGDSLRKALLDWKKYNQQVDKELEYEIRANTWAKRYGTAKIPFSQHLTKLWGDERGIWFDVWNPNEVSPEWKRAQEEHSGLFWHPLYMLPELGSTLGLFAGSLETMGINGVSEYILRKLPVWATSLLNPAKKIKGGLKAGEFILKNYDLISAAIRSAEITTSFAVLANQREKETAQETEEAVTTKIMKNAFDSGANGYNVFSKIINYSENELGIDTSNMEPKDLIGLALAFDIDTGDRVFEKTKKDASDGLMKLINANNALALHDYIEMIPWLGFGGSVMNKLSKMITAPLNNRWVPIRPTNGWFLSPNKLWNDISNNYRSGVYRNAINNMNPNLSRMYYDAMVDAKNSVVDKIAARFMRNDYPRLGLYTKHIGDYASFIAARSIATGIVEGIEEGQQLVLLQRYANGEYEGYYNPYSMFSVPEAFKNLELGKYSFEALFGIHGFGDDEIRKAMSIGAFISPMMGIGMNAVTNFSSNKYNQNLRNLLGQLRTDRLMNRMVGEKYLEEGDTEHLSIFYDSFRKAGSDGVRLAKALNDLKLGVDPNNSLVEQEYIDRDINLMLAAWSLYNNSDFAKDAEKQGIEKYSDSYKEMIIQGARTLVDAQESGKDLISKIQQISELSSDVRQDVYDYIDDNVSQERKLQILEKRPQVLNIVNAFENYFQKYKDILSSWNRQTVNSRRSGFEKMTIKLLASAKYNKDATWFEMYQQETGEATGRKLSLKEVEQILEDENERESFIDYLTNKGLNIASKENVYAQLFDAYETMLRLNKAKSLKDGLTNTAEILSKFRSLTGRDVDLYKINGYIDDINKLVETYQKQAAEILSRRNGITEFINRTQRQENPIQSVRTLDDFFSGDMQLDLGIEDELSNAYGEMMLLQAASNQQMLLANVILHRDLYGPEEIKNAIIGKTGTSDLFDSLIEEYKETNKQILEKDELDLKEDEVDDEEKLRNIRKKAAWKYIINEINEKLRRKYIAHKNTLNEYLAELPENELQQEEASTAPIENQEETAEQQEASEEPTPDERPSATEAQEPEPATPALEEEPEPTAQEPQPVDNDEKDDNDYQDANKPLVDDQEEEPAALEEPAAGDQPLTEGPIPEKPEVIEEPIVDTPPVEYEPTINDNSVIPVEGEERVTAELSLDIDLSQLDIINGKWMLGEHVLDDYIANALWQTQLYMQLLDEGVRAMAYDMPGRSLNSKRAQTGYDIAMSDMLSNTFWYDPDPTDKDGNPIDDPISLTVNGKHVDLKYELKSGRQLAKKLLEKGWFLNVNKYYIVTQSEEARKYFERHPDILPTKEQLMDTYTVSLILEDDSAKACYACSLRQLGTYKSMMNSINRLTGEPIIDPKTGEQQQEEIEKNNEELERRRYETHGIRITGESADLAHERIYQRAAEVLKAQYFVTEGKEIDIKTARKWIDGFHFARKKDSETQEEFDLRQQRVLHLITSAKNKAREQLALPGKKILSYSDIDKMISKLRQNRNAIIEAYMSKDSGGNLVFPKNVKRSVKPNPDSTNISNGKFANIRTSDNIPVLTILTKEGNPFGLASDIVSLSKQIDNGDVVFGYGTGKVRANSPFHILDLRNESTLYENGGVAGKIFINVTTINGTKVPLMLVEQRFNTQYSSKGIKSYIDGNVTLCIDPFTGENISNTHNPSAAEVILYMMFGKLNSKYIPGTKLFSKETQKQFSELIVNQGPRTILKNEKVEARLPYYAAKQLAVINGNLEIGMPEYNQDGDLVYHKKKYSEQELFGDSQESIQKRTAVVNAIAKQMHWNTEKVVMNTKFGSPETELIIKALRKYFTDNKTELTFTIAGVPEFTFDKADLFLIDDSGAPIRILPNTQVVAWMLKTGKILTDVSNSVFYAPYIYASGIENTETPSNDAENIGLPEGSEIDVNSLLLNMSSLENVKQKIKEFDDIYRNSEDYDLLVTLADRAKNSAKYKKYGARIKSVVLDMSLDTEFVYNTVDEFEQAVINKTKKLVEKLSSNKKQLKLRPDAELVVDDSIKKNVLMEDAYNTAIGRKGRSVVPVVDIFENGHVEIELKIYNGIASLARQYVNGVYSTQALLGIFNEDFARQWLQKTLGINQYQIIVTDAVLRSIENKDVFGLTRLVADSILGQRSAQFILRRDSGYGIQFHEAWHYVNLLIHDKQLRSRLYKEFAKYNDEAKGKSFKDIEELMAEDYRSWQQGVLDHPISYRIKNFFQSVGEFLHVVSKRPQYLMVYKNIHKGMYKNAHLDQNSVDLFVRRYAGEVAHGVNIPGVSREATKDFVSVKDFYDVGNAIVDYAMQIYQITTIDKIHEMMSEEGFPKFKQYLIDLAEEQEELRASVIMTFVNNPQALFHMLASRFKDLGISVTMDGEVKRKEDTGENIFDIYQFSLSKKESAGALAKLFMRQVPSSHWSYATGTPVFTLEYNDAIPDVVKYVPFDEAWNLITKNLGNCNSYKEILVDENGNPILDDLGNPIYDPTSIRGMVKRLAKSQAFFEAVDRKLDQIENDSDLQSLLYATINSNTPNMSSISIATQIRTINSLQLIDSLMLDMPPEMLKQMLEEREAAFISERRKEWILQNDNTLRAARNIPRKWSQSILMQGLVNRSENDFTIDKNYAKRLIKDRNAIVSSIDKATKQKSPDINKIKNSIINLLNVMGISCDVPTLDYFILLDFIKSGEVISNSTILKHLKDLINSKQAGTVGYFISLINRNAGNASYNTSVSGQPLKNEIDLERTFVGTKLSSKITKLALAYNAIHPSSEEYAVRLPNGEMGYPNSQNSTVSTEYRLLNSTNGLRAIDKMKSPYCKNSLVLQTAMEFDESTPESLKFKLNLNTGLETDTEQDGADYFGITALEDYLINMFLLDLDPTFGLTDDVKYNNEYTHLIQPTMADKKTHFDIQSKVLKTVHDCVVGVLTEDSIVRYISGINTYENDPNLSEEENNKNKNLIANQLREEQKASGYADVKRYLNFKRYSDNTLNIFAGYFLDEIESLIQYYNKDNIEELVKNPSKIIKNFHGSIKDGKMDFSGNGGLFRYFYDVFTFNNKDAKLNLNQRLEYLYKLQQKIAEGSVKDSDLNDVGLGDVDTSLDLNTLDNVDGFELIRDWLNKLKEYCFDKNNDAKQVLLDAINNKLISAVEYELRDVSTNPNRLLAEYNSSTGTYSPIAVPMLLLQRQNKRFAAKKSPIAKNSDKYVPYGKNTYGHDAVMFYSLMANHVANTMISIIEYEKVNSGDPAMFKYIYASKEDNPDNVETIDVSVPIKLLSGKTVNEKISVKNLYEKDSDKTKRLGSLLSPGDEIRTDYNEKEIPDEEDRAYLTGRQYTNLTIKDFIAQSEVLQSEIIPRFETLLFVDYIRKFKIKEIEDLLRDRIEKYGKNNYDLERFINDIYTNNHGTRDTVKLIFEKTGVYDDFVAPNLKLQLGPYDKINVSDALVIVRPAMYRKIRKGLGQWNDDCEEAYNIIQKNGDWMHDPVLAQKVSKLELYPLKLSFYNNDIRELSPGNFINVSVLNKQAVFPMFKFQALSDTGKALYKRMNMPGNELDMVSFESAVKSGAPKNAPGAYDEKKVSTLGPIGSWIDKESDKHIDFDSGAIVDNESDDVIPVTVLDIRFLRYLLNTQSHDADSRNIGTQVFKIMYLNLYDNAQYGSTLNYISPQKGSVLKTDIIGCINALTLKGLDEIHSELYFYDKKSQKMIPNDASISKFVKRIVENLNLGVTAEEIIENGCIAESLTLRTVFEQAVSSYINKHVIGIKTHGGTAIQQSIFGFTDYTDNHVAWSEDKYRNYNDGKEIQWHKDNGTIEVMLSANFFKSVVPKEISEDYEAMRDWLYENKIIGNDAKPFGIAYRIPTQGLSSAFAITVADILPETVGDLIVLPREITGQTGSDYDIDKIFLATLCYENGELVVPDGEIDKNWNLDQRIEYYKKQSSKAILNRLLFDYLSILQDPKSYALSRKSIDVITSQLRELLLKKITPAQKEYRPAMYELLPSFLSDRKLEFKTGKDGIGPFALNITNLTSTLAVHLTMRWDDIAKQYGFGDLDEILGQDGSYIADWLSAMVSAHVDVAKDPYIFKINVNKVTYNHTAFLLRAGKGISTFSFLAQPILKEYASIVMLSGGMYGRYLTGYETTNETNSKRIRRLKNGIIKKYIQNIELLLKQEENNIDKDELLQIKTGLAKFKYDSSSYKERSKTKPKYTMDRSKIFDFDEAVHHIQVYNDKENSSAVDLIRMYFFNLNCMYAFEEINKYAEKLSDLVLVSQIDTEKFGSTIQLQKNFRNRLNRVKYDSTSSWIIKDAPAELNDTPGYAMKKYFEESFLLIKFDTATKLMLQILRRQLLTATSLFLDLFDEIASQINGTMKYDIPVYEKDPKTGKYYPKVKINPKTGKKSYFVEEQYTFKPFFDDDTVMRISLAIDNIARFNILFNSAVIFKQKKDQLLLPGESNMSDPVDLSFGGDFNKLIHTVSGLILGTKDLKSLPIRVHDFLQYILKNQDSEQAEGLVEDGKIINDFLLYLYPLAKTKNNKLDRMFLDESSIRTADYKKEKMIADFGTLLNHKNEDVRNLAKDIVIYAYYTSYDTPGRNTFFNLVPLYYRSTYDEAIKLALRSSSKNDLTDLLKNPILGVSRESLAEYYLDIISRNYWYDDKIVKPILLPTKNKFSPSASGYLEFRPSEFTWTDKDTKQRFPGLNITTNELNSPLFVKVRKRNVTVLYKRVGKIVIKQSAGGKLKTLNNASIYMAVQKAGISVSGTKFFEFYKSSPIPSIFLDNILPKKFNNDLMWTYIENIVKQYNESLQKSIEKDKNKLHFILEIDRTVPEFNLSDENRDLYNKSVYKDYDDDVKRKPSSAFGGGVRVIPNKKAISYVTNSSEMIVNVGKPSDAKGNEIQNSQLIDLKSAFNEAGNLNVESILQDIRDFATKLSDYRKTYKNRLSFNIEEELVPVSEEEKQEFVNRSVDNIKNTDESITKELLELYRVAFEENAESQIRLIKMYQLADLSIKILSSLGVNIQLVQASKMTDLSRAAMSAAYDNRSIIGEKGTELATKGLLYLSNSDIRSSEYETYLSTIDSGITSFVYEVPDEFSTESEESKEDFDEIVNEQLSNIETLAEQKELEVFEKVEQAKKKTKKTMEEYDAMESDDLLIDIDEDFLLFGEDDDTPKIIKDAENTENNKSC